LVTFLFHKRKVTRASARKLLLSAVAMQQVSESAAEKLKHERAKACCAGAQVTFLCVAKEK
jgi:exopolyphosphatase/pppGpp-phosphohydrolase